MTVKKLPEKTLRLWQIRAAVFNLLVLLICFYFRAAYSFVLAVGIIITLICQFGILWYLPRFIRSYRIRITDGAVVINRGVFIKTTHIMPYSRMIYTQTFITPIAKLMGLEAFSLKAARSRITVPEMLNSDADRILKLLSQEAKNEKGL